jgi:putative nucleotidyltransferase with HDIG domain
MTVVADINLNSIIKTELPPLPEFAMRVATLTRDFNASTRSIADAIGCDPILSARVLRAANSSLYCLERRVTALPMAVNALGNETIHSLVIASAASGVFNRKGRPGAVEKSLWQHSLAVGLAGRELMIILGLRGSEEAFLCGLFHDVGKLLLMRHNMQGYLQVISDTEEKGLLAGEQAVFGYTHTHVGAIVARGWDLPEEICYAVLYHHHPGEAEQNTLLARIVDVADALANKGGVGLRPKDGDLVVSESVIALRLSEEQLQEVWDKTSTRLAEITSVFN